MKISIITATYNSFGTIRDTLESVLSQSFKDYEYIIKDGGSKDGTLDIVQEYEPRFEGVCDGFLKRIGVFINGARTLYLPLTFVTMRDGGVSSSGISSHLQINKDHHRALKENGVYSNYFLLLLRYINKLIELTKATCGCADGLRADGK